MRKINDRLLITEIMAFSVIISIFLNYVLTISYTTPYSIIWFLTFSFVLILLKIKSLTRRDFILLTISDAIATIYVFWLMRGENLTDPSFLLQSGTDERGFWTVASLYLDGYFGIKYTAYPYILYAEFLIFGKNYFCCLLFNVFLVQTMKTLFCRKIKEFISDRSALLAATIIVAFFPYSFLISTHLYRESLYFIFVFISFYYFAKYLYDKSERCILLAALLIMPVLYLHIGFLPILFVYVLVYIRDQKGISRDNIYKTVPAIISLAVLIVFSLRGSSADTYLKFSSGNAVERFMARLSTHSGTTLRAGSAYLLWVEIHNIWQLLVFTPLKTFYYLFSPLPMNWRGISDVVAFLLDSSFHLTNLCFAIKILRKPKKYNISPDKFKVLKFDTFRVPFISFNSVFNIIYSLMIWIN